MRIKSIFLLVSFILTFAIGCGNSQAERPQYGKAFDFEAKNINGNAVRLSDYSGKIIILNFFATWCPPCRIEMPDFNQIAKEYKTKVEVIGINVGKESLSKVQQFVKTNNLEFTVIIDDGSLSNLYGPIRAIPVTVIIDKDFNIARRYVGMRTKEQLAVDIGQLL